MKTLLLIHLIALNFASATGTEPKPASTADKILAACLKNRSESRLGREHQSCVCLARTLSQALSDSTESGKKIDWASRVLNETMSQQEFERDEYHLVEYLDGVIDGCKTNSSRH